MAKYLVEANYIGEGVKGLLKDGGSRRRAAVEELFKSMGGTIESYYYAFGDTDLYIIGDWPSNVAVAAAALAVTSTGMVTVKTTVLLTPEEIDEAVKASPAYSPPGQ